jgi:iron complex outermembrane receptor protein
MLSTIDRLSGRLRWAAVIIAAQVFLLVAGAQTGAAQTAPTGTGVIRGKVIDPTGAVVVGAEVSLTSAAPAVQPITSTTDGQGIFRFDKIPAGDYRLTARSEGFDDTVVTIISRADGERALDVTLVPAGFTQDVTVTATRIETPIASLPNTVTVIDNNAIRSRTAVSDDLASLLETSVPGFGPSLKKLTGRGESLRGRNPLYTVNGVPQHTPLRDGERDGHTIDMDFLERVEVIHGSSAMQGIGGTGGIVNLVTRSPKADGSWTQDVKLSLASHDSFDSDGVSTKLSYLLGKRVGKFDFIGGVSYHKRGMFFDARGDLVGLYATQGDIMDSTQRGIYAKAGVALAPQQRLEVTVSDFKLERDGDFMAVPGSRAAGRLTTSIEGDPRATVGDPARNDATTVSVEYRNKNLFGGDAIIQAYTYDYWALFEGGALPTFALTTGGPGFLDQSAITAEKVGAKLTYSMPGSRLAGFATTAGLDVTRDESAQVLARTGRTWVPPIVLSDVAPFVQTQRAVGNKLFLSGGLRLEAAGFEVKDFTTLPSSNNTLVRGGSPSFSDVLPNIGAVYHATREISVYSSFSEGFTMPDVGRVLRAVNRPNLDVDSLLEVEPVVTTNVEFGGDYRIRGVRLHADYYRSNADNGSLLDANADGIFQVRREPTNIQGVDLVAEVPIARQWSAGGTYSWIRGRYDSNRDGEMDTDLDGVNIAPNRVNLFVQGAMGQRLSGRLQVSTLLERQFKGLAARTGRDFGGYTTADLSLAYDTGAGVVRFGVENLLDKQYVAYFSQTESVGGNDTFFAGPGRGLTITFERRF